MKRIRTIIGIVLIILAFLALYFWNVKTKEEALNSQTILEETIIQPSQSIYERAIEKRMAFFPIPQSWIYAKSEMLKKGDMVGFYLLETEEKIGSYEISLLNDAEFEIMCSLDDYFKINSLVNCNEYKDTNQLVIALEASNE